MEELGMENLYDTPSKAVVPSPNTAWIGTNKERLALLTEISKSIARKYITICFNKRSTMSTGDGVYDYSQHLLTIGRLYLEYNDAIKEGDDMRVLQCWKYLLPIFQNSGRKTIQLKPLNCYINTTMGFLQGRHNNYYGAASLTHREFMGKIFQWTYIRSI